MDALVRDGYVDSHSLRFMEIRAPEGHIEQVRLDGVIHCSDGIAVEVTKFMDARQNGRRIEVISTYYRYHAWRPGGEGEFVLRYDQAHGEPHCHRFSPDGEGLTASLTLDAMPRLDEVIRDAVDTVRAWAAGSI